jgi:hypothetical protein
MVDLRAKKISLLPSAPKVIGVFFAQQKSPRDRRLLCLERLRIGMGAGSPVASPGLGAESREPRAGRREPNVVEVPVRRCAALFVHLIESRVICET